ncbi:MAG: hypothetical protein WCY25_10915 [Moheibacter sp.]
MDILELLSNQGITFNQSNQDGETNGIVQNYHYPEKLISNTKKGLEKKDEMIKILKEKIRHLKL